MNININNQEIECESIDELINYLNDLSQTKDKDPTGLLNFLKEPTQANYRVIIDNPPMPEVNAELDRLLRKH